ncbi:MAG TPA: ferredoxin [Verrucomicrobiae bacterium]|jgi:ferredoxin
MAEKNSRLRENAPGAYYITDECIDCDMCRVTAPSIFKRQDTIGFSVAFHQPENELERLQAEEALVECPTGAIGNDGEQ